LDEIYERLRVKHLGFPKTDVNAGAGRAGRDIQASIINAFEKICLIILIRKRSKPTVKVDLERF
jgi:hypothetical protein